MPKTAYKPVAHDAAFKKKILAKSGVKKAYEALEEEYAALHTMLDARLAAGLTQACVNPAARRASSIVWRAAYSSSSASYAFFTPDLASIFFLKAASCATGL